MPALNHSSWPRVWRVPPEVAAASDYHAMQWAVARAAAPRGGDEPGVAAAAGAWRWVFWCNEHTFLVVENLVCLLRAHERAMVAGAPPARHSYIGAPLAVGDTGFVINSGAAGFALARPLADALARQWRLSAHPDAQASGTRQTQRRTSPRCDVCFMCVTRARRAPRTAQVLPCRVRGKGTGVAQCMAALTGARAADTRDPADTASRFLVYGPTRHVKGELDTWYTNRLAKLDPPAPPLPVRFDKRKHQPVLHVDFRKRHNRFTRRNI